MKDERERANKQARSIVEKLNGKEISAFSQLIAVLRQVPKIESTICLKPADETAEELSLLFNSSELADAKPGASRITPAQPITLEIQYPGSMHADYVVGYTNDKDAFKEIAHGWFGDIIAACNFFM